MAGRRKHLNWLESEGLVREISGAWWITDAGDDLLHKMCRSRARLLHQLTANDFTVRKIVVSRQPRNEAMKLVRIPARFYADHMERGLPTPTEQKGTARHVWIDLDDPATAELLSDAEHYAHPYGPDNCSCGLIASAKATVAALRSADQPSGGRVRSQPILRPSKTTHWAVLCIGGDIVWRQVSIGKRRATYTITSRRRCSVSLAMVRGIFPSEALAERATMAARAAKEDRNPEWALAAATAIRESEGFQTVESISVTSELGYTTEVPE